MTDLLLNGEKHAKAPCDFPIPVHPGDVLQEMLDEQHFTQVELAEHLKTDTARINEICRRRRGVSAEMASCLGKPSELSRNCG